MAYKKIEILPENVYSFVNNISKDPNPIHLNEHPIIPGDLFVSLYITTLYRKEKVIPYGKFEFKRAVKAPTEIIIKEKGIYTSSEKQIISFEKEKGRIELNNPLNAIKYKEEIEKEVTKYMENYALKISKEISHLLAIYCLQTNELSKLIREKFKKPKLAIYTAHTFSQNSKEVKAPCFYKIHNEGKNKKKIIYGSIPYKNLVILKELIIKI